MAPLVVNQLWEENPAGAQQALSAAKEEALEQAGMVTTHA